MTFTHDTYSHGHLHNWHYSGQSPFDWDLATLEAFENWVIANQDEISEHAGWTELSNYWEGEQTKQWLEAIKVLYAEDAPLSLTTHKEIVLEFLLTTMSNDTRHNLMTILPVSYWEVIGARN